MHAVLLGKTISSHDAISGHKTTGASTPKEVPTTLQIETRNVSDELRINNTKRGKKRE